MMARGSVVFATRHRVHRARTTLCRSFRSTPARVRQRGIGGPSGSGAPGGSGMFAAEFVAMLLWGAASFVIVYWLSGTFDWNPFVVVGAWLLTGFIVLGGARTA